MHRGKTIRGYSKKAAICKPRTEGSEEANAAGTLCDSKSRYTADHKGKDLTDAREAPSFQISN